MPSTGTVPVYVSVHCLGRSNDCTSVPGMVSLPNYLVLHFTIPYVISLPFPSHQKDPRKKLGLKLPE